MSLVTGIDCVGENPPAVVVDTENDHRRVTRLARLHDLLPLSDDQDLTVAVPDQDVIVKPLTLRDTDPGDRIERGRFELAAGLLEPDRLFTFDLVETAQPERFLGLIYRTTRLEDHCSALLPDLRPTVAQPRMRAAALAAGYFAFCEPESGELQALVDLAGDPISVALTYRGRTISLGCLRNGALADPDLLLVKSGLDGVSAAVLAGSVGLALLWVLLPLALLQFSLSGVGAWLAGSTADPSSEPAVLFTASVGGLLVLALALDLLDLPHPSVVNGLMALVLAPALGLAMQP